MLNSLRSSLQSKILFVFVVGVVIPALIAAAVGVISTSEKLQNDAALKEESELNSQINLFELELERVVDKTLFVAQAPAVNGFLAVLVGENPEEYDLGYRRAQDLYRAFIANNPEVQDLRLISVEGQELIRISRTSNSGMTFASPESLQFLRNESLYTQALTLPNGSVAISEFDFNSGTAIGIDAYQPSLHYATPSYTESGTLGGVVMLSLDLEPMLELVSVGDQGEETHVLNLEGDYLYSTDFERVLRRDNYFTRVPESALALAEAEGTGILASENSAPNTFTAYSRLAPEGQAAGIDWIVLHERSNASVFEQSTSQAVISLLITLAFLSLLLLIVYASIRSVANPLRRLTILARAVGEGNLDTVIDVSHSQDEIGQLNRAFVDMVTQLRGVNAELEKRVSDRTRELQTVADVNRQISTILQPERLLQDVVDLTKERFHLYHAHIYLLDASGLNLELAAGAGHVGRQMVAENRSISLVNARSIVATCARSVRTQIENNVRQAANFLPHPLLPETQSEAAIALTARGEVLGVLDVQSDQLNYFELETLKVLELLSNQIAIALSNARLFENAERISRHEQAMGRIDRSIQSAVDVDEILKVTVRELGKALRVPMTTIELRMAEQSVQSPIGELSEANNSAPASLSLEIEPSQD